MYHQGKIKHYSNNSCQRSGIPSHKRALTTWFARFSVVSGSASRTKESYKLTNFLFFFSSHKLTWRLQLSLGDAEVGEMDDSVIHPMNLVVAGVRIDCWRRRRRCLEARCAEDTWLEAERGPYGKQAGKKITVFEISGSVMNLKCKTRYYVMN